MLTHANVKFAWVHATWLKSRKRKYIEHPAWVNSIHNTHISFLSPQSFSLISAFCLGQNNIPCCHHLSSFMLIHHIHWRKVNIIVFENFIRWGLIHIYFRVRFNWIFFNRIYFLLWLEISLNISIEFLNPYYSWRNSSSYNWFLVFPMNFERWILVDVAGRSNNKLWLRLYISRLEREIRESGHRNGKKKGEVEREAKRWTNSRKVILSFKLGASNFCWVKSRILNFTILDFAISCWTMYSFKVISGLHMFYFGGCK